MAIQENLPDDFPSPNSVNDTNTRVAIRAGNTDIRDPQGTLLPNSVEYTLSESEWLAVPLDKGKYRVKARSEGQVIYIASEPEAKASLRVTKDFNIETNQRVAIYLKSQSAYDNFLKEIQVLIGAKADKNEVYTREQTEQIINTLIEASLGGLTSIMKLKGVVDTLTDLNNLQDVEESDVYQVKDTGVFVVAITNDQGVLEWQELSGSIVDLSAYYTKGQVDLFLSDKADKQKLNEYYEMVRNFIPTFTWEQDDDPSVPKAQAPQDYVYQGSSLNDIKQTLGTDWVMLESLNHTFFYDQGANKYYKAQIKTSLTGLSVTGWSIIGGTIASTDFVAYKNTPSFKAWIDKAQAIQDPTKILTQGFGVVTTRKNDPQGHPRIFSIFVKGNGNIYTDLVAWNQVAFDDYMDLYETTEVPDTTQTTPTDPTKEGDTWFQPSTGLIFVRRVSQVDGSLFWLNPIQNFIVANQNYVTIDTAQRITGPKTFSELPLMDSDILPSSPRQLVTKAYVDANAGGGGGGVLPTGVALLDADQTFTGTNTFEVQPISASTETFENLGNKAFITKEQLESKFNINPSIQNPKVYANLSSNELVTKGVLDEALANGGGTGLPAGNYAELDKVNTFLEQVKLSKDPIDPEDAVRLSYMEGQIDLAKDDLNRNIDTAKDEVIDSIHYELQNDYYNKTQTDTKLQDYVRTDQAAAFMKYRGDVPTFDDLPTDAEESDCYYVKAPQDKQGFWLKTATKWSNVGTGVALDVSKFVQLTTENVFTNNNIFSLTEGDTFRVGDEDITIHKGSVTFENGSLYVSETNVEVGSTLVVKDIASFTDNATTFKTSPLITTPVADDALVDNQLVTKSFVENSITNLNLSDYAKLNRENEFLESTTFNKSLILQEGSDVIINASSTEIVVDKPLKRFTEQTTVEDNEFITKKWAEANLQLSGGSTSGGGGDVTLDTEQTFTAVKTFDSGATPIITDEPIQELEAVNKKYVDALVGSKYIISETIPSPISYLPGTLWIKPSYEADPNNDAIFNDTPGIFILTSDKRWWDLHKEVLH